MLLLNGKNLTGLPLHERKRLLSEHIEPEPHRLELTIGERISKALLSAEGSTVAERLTERLDGAMELGYEGLMLKELDGIYEPNARGWFKIKPDYDEGYFQTLDVLILGGYYGESASGRHWKSNGVSHFLVGLRAPAGTAVEGTSRHPPMFAFCKVWPRHSLPAPRALAGRPPAAPAARTRARANARTRPRAARAQMGTGFGGAELRLMRERLDKVQVRWSEQPCPPHLCGWRPTTKERVPDVWCARAACRLPESSAQPASPHRAARPPGRPTG